jgi:hypothetical protein
MASVREVHWALPSMRYGATSASVHADGDFDGWVAYVRLVESGAVTSCVPP